MELLMNRSEMARKYLEALNIKPSGPTLAFLGEMAKQHVATFAFSSVGCRLGEDLPLDFASLYQRIVVQRRGGYCFEQNGLFFEILEELGFDVELYLARVIYNQDTHPGLTHRITMVELQGRRYILDVGFGPLGPRIPVLMSEQESEDGERRFRVFESRPGEFHLQVIRDGDFFSLYRFELSRYGQADCEVGHFYSHRHPAASFVNHLVVSLIMENETRSLRDLKYWVTTRTEKKEQLISNAQQLRRILVDELGIQISEAECCQLAEATRPKPKEGCHDQ
jgi:N-hydroxyarylamine O-acetyltransferase